RPVEHRRRHGELRSRSGLGPTGLCIYPQAGTRRDRVLQFEELDFRQRVIDRCNQRTRLHEVWNALLGMRGIELADGLRENRAYRPAARQTIPRRVDSVKKVLRRTRLSSHQVEFRLAGTGPPHRASALAVM